MSFFTLHVQAKDIFHRTTFAYVASHAVSAALIQAQSAGRFKGVSCLVMHVAAGLFLFVQGCSRRLGFAMHEVRNQRHFSADRSTCGHGASGKHKTPRLS